MGTIRVNNAPGFTKVCMPIRMKNYEGDHLQSCLHSTKNMNFYAKLKFYIVMYFKFPVIYDNGIIPMRTPTNGGHTNIVFSRV